MADIEASSASPTNNSSGSPLGAAPYSIGVPGADTVAGVSVAAPVVSVGGRG